MVYIGTSGWTYKHWKEWYAGVKAKDRLVYMAGKFSALEANGPFYRLPSRETFEKWREITPADFRFAVKAHRFLTHRKRLVGIEDGIRRERESLDGLQEKLAVVIWQFPPQFHLNFERLDRFLSALREWDKPRHAVEFRHESWFIDPVREMLSAHRVANCLSDAATWPCWDSVTTDLVYVRLHGGEQTYASSYSDESLQSWADKVAVWRQQGRTVFVFFDNDARGAAPLDALRLQALVDRIL